MSSAPPALPEETPNAAYNRGRAVEQKLHQYTANHATGQASCACGVVADVEVIGDHIERAAELSGSAARDKVIDAIAAHHRATAGSS